MHKARRRDEGGEPPSKLPRPPPVPMLTSQTDLGSDPELDDEQPHLAFEPCYSIALGDRNEPSASSEVFGTAAKPKRPPKIEVPPPERAPKQIHTSYESSSPRYIMTPRGTFDVSKAFSLHSPSMERGDSIDDIFGHHLDDDGGRLLAGVTGFVVALLLNLLALPVAFLYAATGQRRTYYCAGVCIGTVVQCLIIAGVVILRYKA